jgi:nicotinamidase-related amidase
MKQAIQFLLIDPQNDFCDIPAAEQPTHPLRPSERIAPALPVAGAHADMQRLARWLDSASAHIEQIHVTLDSHQPFDIAHPGFWRDSQGRAPAPFTVITCAHVQGGRWDTADPAHRPHGIEYLRALERKGKQHMIWPEHCLVGGWGHNVHAHVAQALADWSRQHGRDVRYVFKGLNPMTEHFSAFEAEVPDPADADTQYNERLHRALASAQTLVVAGEALSHCVAASVRSLTGRLQSTSYPRIVLLTDCMSPVPGLEALGEAFLTEMRERGVELARTEELTSAA